MLVQISKGLTFPQRCIDFYLQKRFPRLRKTRYLRESLATQRERNRAACVGQVGDTVRKHVTTPRCRSRPHHSSSRCPRPPRRRRRSSHRRHRSLRRGQGQVCERSIQLALWGPSRRHVQLLLWWPKPVSWDKKI